MTFENYGYINFGIIANIVFTCGTATPVTSKYRQYYFSVKHQSWFT